jgi:stress response protein YsnF
VRYEGETMIVPVVREELVVTKRLLLVEEVHVHQQTVTTHSSQTVELQREELHYERIMTLPTPPIPSPES